MNRSLAFSFARTLAQFSGAVILLTSFAQVQSRQSDSVAATYARGILHVSMPYDAPRSGAGNLLIEVLDPEDRPAVSIDRHARRGAGQGFWEQNFCFPKTSRLTNWYGTAFATGSHTRKKRSPRYRASLRFRASFAFRQFTSWASNHT